jgi:G6PDH family F420-dependent oxidoreductase
MHMKIGYFLSSEENGPKELVAHAAKAQEAGFRDLWISDHYHPWIDAQGHSPFVWSVIGAIAQAAPELTVTTAVTCPTMRIHPAVIAQATATASLLLDGRFIFGVGTGEALNEHIFGDKWPEASVRREQLEESIEIIRALWTGETVSHEGRHYRVEHARIYDPPLTPPKVVVSGFGPAAVDLAAKIGDGFCTVQPDAESVERFRSQSGPGKLVQGGLKVVYGADKDAAKQTAFETWPNDGLPGELAQILPTPAHFEQASSLVDIDTLTESVPCGPDIEEHLEAIREYEKAGFDELYISQMGPDQDAFLAAYSEHVLPLFNGELARSN